MIRLCFSNATHNKILPIVQKYGAQASNRQKLATRHYYQSGILFSKNASTKHEEEQQTRNEILKASLSFVPEYGWTQKSVSNGALSVGLVEMTHGLFLHPGAELVQYFNSSSNEALVESISATKKFKFDLINQNNSDETLEFLRSAVQTRLQMILPYISKWPQAMSLMVMPQHINVTLADHATLVDDILYHAGDGSTNLNWYVRRANLALIINSAELHLIQDKSEDYEETWSFLKRRLSNMAEFERSKDQIQEGCSRASDSIFAFGHFVRNVFTFNVRL